MSENMLAALILLSVCLFIIPLFLISPSESFVKEYFKCVLGTLVILIVCALAVGVINTIWWALEFILEVQSD